MFQFAESSYRSIGVPVGDEPAQHSLRAQLQRPSGVEDDDGQRSPYRSGYTRVRLRRRVAAHREEDHRR